MHILEFSRELEGRKQVQYHKVKYTSLRYFAIHGTSLHGVLSVTVLFILLTRHPPSPPSPPPPRPPYGFILPLAPVSPGRETIPDANCFEDSTYDIHTIYMYTVICTTTLQKRDWTSEHSF